MQVTSQASVNDDGQVSVSITIDGCTQPHPGTATRANGRSFALEILTKQGDEGERAAVEWLRSKGWDVGKPNPRQQAIVLEHVGLDGFARWAVSLDGPNPEPAIPVPGRQEAHDLAAKLNSMGGEKPRQTDSVTQKYGVPRWAFSPKGDEKPDEKPADKEKKPDLPALYRAAAAQVRPLAERSTPAWFRDAREALIACAKADPETAEAMVTHADLLTSYECSSLRAVADDLEKCARLAETAADVASPCKLAREVATALDQVADLSSADRARNYLKHMSAFARVRLSSDLADRVKRYVEAS